MLLIYKHLQINTSSATAVTPVQNSLFS